MKARLREAAPEEEEEEAAALPPASTRTQAGAGSSGQQPGESVRRYVECRV